MHRRRRAGEPRGRADAQRPRSSFGPTPLATAIAAVFADHPGLQVIGHAIDETRRVLIITGEDGGPPQGRLLCVASTDHPIIECARSDVDALLRTVLAVDAASALLVGAATFGNDRADVRLLVTIALGEHGLVLDAMSLGGSDGEGYGCEEYEGYCVDVRSDSWRPRLRRTGLARS